MNGVAWWRRPPVLGAIVGVLVILAVAAIVFGSDDSEPSQLAVRAGTTSTTEETTTTSVDESTTTTEGGTSSGLTTTTAGRTGTTRATTAAPATTTTTRPTTLTEPPASTMRSTDGQVAGERGTYCWRGDGQGLCADSQDIDPKQTLRVRQGTSVEIRWAIDERPSEVQAKYTEGNQWVDMTPPLPAANPTSFVATMSPGVHTIAVFSVWSRGDVVHYFKVEIYT